MIGYTNPSTESEGTEFVLGEIWGLLCHRALGTFLQLDVSWLGLVDLFLKCGGNFQNISEASIHYDQFELSDLLLEFGRQGFQYDILADGFSTECIGNHVGLTRVVIYSKVIILDQL